MNVKAWEHTTGREAAPYRGGAVTCCSQVRLPCTLEQTRHALEIGRGGLSCGTQSVCTDSNTLSAEKMTT